MASKFARFIGKIIGVESLSRRVRHHRKRFEAEILRHVAHQAALQLHCSDTMDRARSGPYGRVAIVSAMPPSETGLSHFSARMAIENPGAIDVFTMYDSVEDYYDQSAILPNVSIFPTELLGVAAQRAKYRSVVFAFGNSHHNLFVLQRLHSFASFGLPGRVAVEVHDPCSLDIARLYLSGEDRLESTFRGVYGDRLEGADLSDSRELVRRNIFGVKALLDGKSVDEIVVHSRRAQKMIKEDYGNDPHPTIKVGFHPVFANALPRDQIVSSSNTSVGSFGIPGTGKYLQETIQAFVRLKKEGHIGTAIFAGYRADSNISRVIGAIPPEITVISNPSDRELAKAMANVTVAVQLRRHDLGESSGVVPQLLGYRKPVVCSEIGAFIDYGDAVSFISEPVSAESVYSATLEVLQQRSCNLNAIEEYVARHRSQDLLELIEAG